MEFIKLHKLQEKKKNKEWLLHEIDYYKAKNFKFLLSNVIFVFRAIPLKIKRKTTKLNQFF